jgi:hypothetical protein
MYTLLKLFTRYGDSSDGLSLCFCKDAFLTKAIHKDLEVLWLQYVSTVLREELYDNHLVILAVHKSTLDELSVVDHGIVSHDPVTLNRAFGHFARTDTYAVDVEGGIRYIATSVAGLKMKVGIDLIHDVDVGRTAICCREGEIFDGFAST